MNAIVQAPTGRTSLEPRTFEDAMHFAAMLAKSTMIPRDFQNRPENVLVAVQWGREIGLGPLQALQNIAVINGRPTIWGDAMLALVRGSGLCASISETIEGDGEKMEAKCVTQRRDDPVPVTSKFSVEDAKKAGLWGKQGPWQQYPKRMLQLRARGFALRDAYPDVLRGVISAEEAQDIPTVAEPFTGPTIDARAEPVTREAINAEVPITPRKQTITEWLDALEPDLAGAADSAAVDAVIARPDVQKAMDAFKNGARDRLNGMVKAALDRTSVDADAEFLGAGDRMET